MRLNIRPRFVAALLLGLSLTVIAQSPTGGVSPVPPTVTPAIQHQQTIAQKIADSKTRMDINTATAAQLKTLPGIGDAYASRIIAGRPYTAKNQLVQRGVLPQNVYAGITDQIIAHRPKK